MRYVFGYAGIPRSIFDTVRRSWLRLVGRNGEFLSETFKRDIPDYYRKGHANFFLKSFWKKLSDDAHNRLEDTGFAIIYVASHAGANAFAQQFFPSVLTIPVEWRLEGGNRTTLGRSANMLIQLMERASNLAREVIPEVTKELAEHDNTTPWLLPVKNFQSKALRPTFERVHQELISLDDRRGTLGRAKASFARLHPPQRIGTRDRSCFVDEKGVEFHPPGKDRHAFARNTFDAHPPVCLLSGRRRFGAPYDRAFHYDCERGPRPLKGDFYSCHEPLERKVGSPHLNIAPNDYVRA